MDGVGEVVVVEGVVEVVVEVVVAVVVEAAHPIQIMTSHPKYGLHGLRIKRKLTHKNVSKSER